MPALAALEGVSTTYDRLKEIVPVIQGGPAPGVEFSGANFSFAAGAGATPTRMMNRDRTLSINVAPTALIVEASAYTQFETFMPILEAALDAVSSAAAIAGIQRVGLRYVDEIRVPGIATVADWEPFIDPTLLPALHLDDSFRPTTTQGLVEFDVNEHQKTVMRFGAMDGFTVDPNGPLVLRRRGEGPYFLIDLDSFWLAPNDATPEFDAKDVLEKCVQLRKPVRTLFEASITDRLRDEVLRKEVTA